ncbi:hypothetical protein BLNAU_12810 [Blattamonas nauphoetae]|uniref:Uncharacterized protein n=1 Tax=Blattamonas nauphoetae TaxID=2049346 RepID=A0ABQ9XIJ3_9EUKA|nr:hypothetical protein BLNAU_12810 [Blattamonas nauphoetae]
MNKSGLIGGLSVLKPHEVPLNNTTMEFHRHLISIVDLFFDFSSPKRIRSYLESETRASKVIEPLYKSFCSYLQYLMDAPVSPPDQHSGFTFLFNMTQFDLHHIDQHCLSSSPTIQHYFRDVRQKLLDELAFLFGHPSLIAVTGSIKSGDIGSSDDHSMVKAFEHLLGRVSEGTKISDLAVNAVKSFFSCLSDTVRLYFWTDDTFSLTMYKIIVSSSKLDSKALGTLFTPSQPHHATAALTAFNEFIDHVDNVADRNSVWIEWFTSFVNVVNPSKLPFTPEYSRLHTKLIELLRSHCRIIREYEFGRTKGKEMTDELQKEMEELFVTFYKPTTDYIVHLSLHPFALGSKDNDTILDFLSDDCFVPSKSDLAQVCLEEVRREMDAAALSSSHPPFILTSELIHIHTPDEIISIVDRIIALLDSDSCLDDDTILRIFAFHRKALSRVYLPDLFKKAGRSTEQYFHALESLLTLHLNCSPQTPIGCLLSTRPDEHEPTFDEWDDVDLETGLILMRVINQNNIFITLDSPLDTIIRDFAIHCLPQIRHCAAQHNPPQLERLIFPSIDILGKYFLQPCTFEKHVARQRERLFIDVCKLFNHRVTAQCIGRTGFFSRLVADLLNHNFDASVFLFLVIVDGGWYTSIEGEDQRIIRKTVPYVLEEGWQDVLETIFVKGKFNSSNTKFHTSLMIQFFGTNWVKNIQTPATHRLDAPNYHGSNAMIANLHLSLLGKNTNIVHSDELKCSEQKDYQDISPSERPDIQIDVSPIILITNSTFSVSKVFFSATKPNHSIAKISNSFFTLDKCVLHSSAIDCPIIVTRSSSSRSEVKIINTQHVSASYGTLLPFVQLAPSPDSEMEDSTEVSVIGAELDISHCDLCFGTGPLVDFGEIQSMPDLSTIVTTTLIDTVILNTTSSSAPHPFAPLPTISQSVIGCSITDCTNHFAGTAVLNINHAQHFSTLNTTVMSCHTTLPSNTDYTNMNFTTRPSLSASTTGITRCLFKTCFTSLEGAAISLFSSNSIAIAECSFADCYCSADSNGLGGAVFVTSNVLDFGDPSTTITKSSFANCRAHWGSAISLYHHQRVTISELAVENCLDLKLLWLQMTGLGALNVVDTTEYVSIFNCIFSHCHNENAGSVILEMSNASHNCDSLAFRANSVEKQSVTRDFVTTLPPSSDFASMISNCDSTSFGDSKPLVAVGTTDYGGNLHITHSLTDLIAGVPTQRKLSIASLSLTEDPTDSGLATCSVTVNETVTGTMILLLDNSLLRSGTTSTPTLQRLVSVTFDGEDEEGATTASTSVTYGPTGLLQSSLRDYVMMTASMKGWRIIPIISIAKCTLSSTGNEIEVSVYGANFEDGTYQAVLQKEGEESTETYYFERHNGQLICSVVAYPEESAELEYDTEYTLVSVTCEGQNLNRSVEKIVFTTPVAPPRLIGIGKVVFASGKKEVILPFVSSGLPPSTTYTMIIDSVPKGSESSHSRTLTFNTDDDGSLASTVQTVYPQTSLLPSFGTEYTVRTFSLDSETSFIALNSFGFSIPEEPSRLTRVAISYESNQIIVVLTLSGRLLSPQDHTLFLKNTADDADTPTIPIVYSSTGSGSWSASLSLFDAPLLKDGRTYTVTNFKEGGESGEDVQVEETVSFTVSTSLAVINDLSFEFHPGTQNTGTLLFSTDRMLTSTNLVVTVKGETTFNLTGLLTISTAQTGSITATLFSTTATVQLEYGKTYTITNIVISATNEEVLFIGKRDFTIPKAVHRVVSLKSSEWLDDGRGMTYTFFSVGLASEEYDMELTDTTPGSESEPVAKNDTVCGCGWREAVRSGHSLFLPR